MRFLASAPRALLAIAALAASATATPCPAGQYYASASSACAACAASAPFSLAGATSSAQCRAAPFAGPTDTVFSFYGSAAEIVADYTVTGTQSALTAVADTFGNAGGALSLTTAVTLTTTAARPALPSGGAARTSSVWIKTTSCSSAQIYMYGSPGDGLPWAELLNSQGGGTAGSSYLWGSANDWDTNTSVCDGLWHHLAFAIDGVGALQAYIDGALVNNLVHLGYLSAAQFNTTANVAFSVSGDGSGYGRYSGSLFDIRVYGRALSAAEVAAAAAVPDPVALSANAACPSGFLARRIVVASDPDSSVTVPLPPLLAAYKYSSVGYALLAWGGGGGAGGPGYGGDYTYGTPGGGAFVSAFLDAATLPPNASLVLIAGGGGGTSSNTIACPSAVCTPPCGAGGCSAPPAGEKGAQTASA